MRWGEIVTEAQLRAEHTDFIAGYADYYGVTESEVPSYDAWLEIELSAGELKEW